MTEICPFSEPFQLFEEWYQDAEKNELNDPNAMALATSTSEGFPSVRMVLMKAFDEEGFVFYTNLQSRKGSELLKNPRAALCFHWKSLRRQIRIEGDIEAVSNEEAEAYFASRPRMSQIGAWASQQSRLCETKFDLEKRIADYTLKFGLSDVPRPDFWSGFRLIPKEIEFWQDKAFRLHDRFVYEKKEENWLKYYLFP